MARGRSSISPYIIREIFLLSGQGMTPNKIAEKLKLSGNTVRKHLGDESNIERYSELMSEIEQINEKSNNKILELVQGKQYSEIATNIVDMFNKENLEEERKTNGIRNLISLLGNTVDKTLKIQNLEIRKMELEISKKQLAIKEKELELRISNPEAFHTVTIVNDAPLVEEDNESTNPYN